MGPEIGKRCESCVISMGQPWCEDLNRQLPTAQGYEPLTPGDCKIKNQTDGKCVIVAVATEENAPEPE